ncbi:cdc42 effector protein 3-like [Trichomycterus rosablanca]|uniref:cdc42 effector protein 3-like n=1 Tax=Trichomycterus rosablanca TaxID=2290929 RepID=UPI002F35D2D6
MPLRTLQIKPSSKRWSSRSRQKILTVNMISYPLADFRHLTHIGTDMNRSFGDLSFLQPAPSLMLQSSMSEQNLFQACSPPPKPPRINMDKLEEGSSGNKWASQQETSAQRRQKCSSLPLLDTEEVEEGNDELQLEEASVSQSPSRGSLSSGRNLTLTSPEELQSEETDPNFAFDLDLGPSILDDVLQVMNKLHQ